MEKNCLYCETPMIVKNKLQLFCSPNCKVYYCREKHKPECFCNFCGDIITEKGFYSFCSNEHRKKFFKRKENNKPIFLKMDSRTIIETKHYDKIKTIIDNFKNKQKKKWTIGGNDKKIAFTLKNTKLNVENVSPPLKENVVF